jgi:hypothetical protein
VTLYHGGRFDLYKYQRFQDVRLVFAPEFAVAFFGGDPDNFMFPRYDFDISFLRVYDGGKPLKNDHYFKWAPVGAREGDLTFVTGHPGRTSRLLTVSELQFQRDTSLIQALLYNSELRGILTEFGAQGAEQRRISEAKLFGVENSLKALKGKLAALQDPSFLEKKTRAENSLKMKVNMNPKLKASLGDAWHEITQAQRALRDIFIRLTYLENNRGLNSKLYTLARILVRASDELPKPNEKRFREFADSNLPQVKQDLFTSAPIYNELEITMLTFSLTKLREALTPDDPFVKKLFGGKSPSEIAAAIVKGSHLSDVAYRKSLFEGGKKAIESSDDTMIQFARVMDVPAREIRKKYEDEIEPIIKKNSEKVAQAQFAVYGTDTYPDATFTLRVSYGQVKGYEENGKHVAPLTNLAGAFERSTGSAPFALPDSWLKAKSSLELQTPLNFCTTNDIIGGNSGSPVVNKDAQIVGLIFDGNIQSLGGDYGFEPSVNRAVAVHGAGILEVLKKVYGADRIVSDLMGH